MLYFYYVSVHNCDGGLTRWLILMQILPVLQVTQTERQLHVVQAFLETDEYKTYLEDAEVCMRVVAHNVVHVRGVKHCVLNNIFVATVVVDMCLSRERCLLRNGLCE